MKCENCNKEHDGSYGSGRFCCEKCARGFSTKLKRKEINEKISKTIINKGLAHGDVQLICEYCQRIYIRPWIKRNSKFCSQLCSTKRN